MTEPADKAKTPFENQLDEMGHYVTYLSSTYHLKANDAIALLSLILNYNITVRQMGLTGTKPVENPDGQN
jgi:hypothetical protein